MYDDYRRRVGKPMSRRDAPLLGKPMSRRNASRSGDYQYQAKPMSRGNASRSRTQKPDAWKGQSMHREKAKSIVDARDRQRSKSKLSAYQEYRKRKSMMGQMKSYNRNNIKRQAKEQSYRMGIQPKKPMLGERVGNFRRVKFLGR